MNNVKQKIIDEIRNSVDVFYKVSDVQYKTRCPICGDSQKNLKESHLYLKCSYDANEPILYHCFKCNSSGKVNQKFLEKFNIKLDGLSEIESKIFHRLSNRTKPTVEIMSGTPDMNSPQVKYIESRLGDGFVEEDYTKFKIVWDMNLIIPFITDSRIKNILPSNRNSISFLSSDTSVLMTRLLEDDSEYSSWKKNKIFPSDNRSVYTIKAVIDLFTRNPITINIAEGVFDVLSIYKNFYVDDSIYIATLGSNYESGIDYAIENGLIGPNVTVKVYIDDDIDEKSIKYRLKKYKWLFNEIYLYRNLKYKDVGITIDKIKLLESKV